VKTLGFAPEARAGLIEIARYIAEDNPERALGFVDEIEAKARQAAERPRTFPVHDDVSPGLRAARHGRYLLFFREIGDEVRIVRILHGKRDQARVFGDAR
jgi:toxin ParE1/3/4